MTRAMGASALWSWLAVLLSMCSQALDITAFVAKNDYGCAGWATAGFALLFFPGRILPGRRGRELAIAGVFLGIAVMSKVVLVLSVASVLVVWAVWPSEVRGGAREFGLLAAGIAAGLLPEMARNLVLLHDPLYPLLTSRLGLANPFLGPTATLGVEYEIGQRSRDFAWSIRTFLEAQEHVRYLAGVVLLFPLVAWKNPRLRRGLPLFLAVELAFGAYSSWHFSQVLVRWLAPVLFVHVALGAAAWGEGIELVSRWLGRAGGAARLAGFALPVALVYGTVGFDWSPWAENVWRNALFGNSPTLMIRHPRIHYGGDAMAWLRLNLKPGERVVTTGFQMLYYVSHLDVVAIPAHAGIDEDTFGAKSPERVVRALREYGVKYVMDVAHWKARFYAGSFGAMMMKLMARYPDSVAYQGELSFILDLESLESDLLASCGAGNPAREWDWYR